MSKSVKYKCYLRYSAEGDTTGYMYLTAEEYEIVKRVVDSDNWKDVVDEGWSGGLSIFCPALEKRRN